MRQYPCGDVVKAMTAAVMIMLRMSVQGQTAAPSPNAPGQTNNQNSQVKVTNTQTNGGQLEQVTVTGYIYNYTLTQLETEANGFSHFLVTNLTNTFTEDQPVASGPDFRGAASLFYSKHLFGNDLFSTGITFNYVGSELDFINSDNGTVPAASAGLNPPGYVHLIGNWTTWDCQISYQFGPPVEVTPETPKAGYNKEGKQVVGGTAIAAAPETTCWGWRRLLDNLTLTFGIKNVFDTRPPLAVQANGAQGYDPEVANPIQRFFYGQIEKKF